MPLSEMAVRNAKKREKSYKMADGNGLYLLITAAGAKSWRYDYRHLATRRTMVFGLYPDVSLIQARDRLKAARSTLAEGLDPISNKRKIQQEARIAATNTFRLVGDEWFQRKIKDEGRAESTVDKAEWHLALAYRFIADRPINDLEAPELLELLMKIQGHDKFETTMRVRNVLSRVFRYAIATGRCKRDPAADLVGALTAPTRKHHAALLDPIKVGELLREIDVFEGTVAVRTAMQIQPMVFVRPYELRTAEWTEFQWDKALWRIPAEKMKMRREHIVPLSRQAMELLTKFRAAGKHSKYLFSSLRSPQVPMSDATINAALRRMGYTGDEQTCHGFRTIASTMLNEIGWNRDWIERQLAHVEGNQVRAAYNAAEWLPDRTRMMQAWSDHLDTMKYHHKT